MRRENKQYENLPFQRNEKSFKLCIIFHTCYPICHSGGIMLMHKNLPEATFKRFPFFLLRVISLNNALLTLTKMTTRKVFSPFYSNITFIQGLFLWFIAMELHASHWILGCLPIYTGSVLKVQWFSGFHCGFLHVYTVFMKRTKVGRKESIKFVFIKE